MEKNEPILINYGVKCLDRISTLFLKGLIFFTAFYCIKSFGTILCGQFRTYQIYFEHSKKQGSNYHLCFFHDAPFSI